MRTTSPNTPARPKSPSQVPTAYLVAATANPATPTLLRPDTQNDTHWLKFSGEGAPPLKRDGIGARVFVTAGGLIQMRELHASTNYMAQEPGRVAHFGLGDATVVDEVRVIWLSKGNPTTTILTDVSVDRHLIIQGP